MKVSTPAMKLDVRVDAVKAEDGLLVMEGVAGVLPCRTSLSPAEFRKLLWQALRPSVLVLLLRK